CRVCGAPEAEAHFGGISCRACAAFFRRYFHSKKLDASCTCQFRIRNSHPCRECRILKCLEAGMDPEKIQGRRDKISDKETTCSSMVIFFKFHHRLPFRSTSKLHSAISNWQNFESIRLEKSGRKEGMMTVYELSCIVKIDIDLTWKMVMKMFPDMEKLKIRDRSSLLNNFIVKLWQLIPILDFLNNSEKYLNLKEEDIQQMVIWFYQGCFPEDQQMSITLLRKFVPFWTFNYKKIILPIAALGLEKTEMMAIIWMIFVDYGFTNISSECQEMCRNIKKMILRELKNYQIDRNFDEMRFLDTLETLEIIERGEKKFLEEMMICEMHNVRIHDDFKAILKENRL
ncbi:LOW QUALITY PROTEIN: Protein CBG17072, partial [Caenorhabditis briggsae]